MKSKTLISKQIQKKRNSNLVETISAAKKNLKWIEVAEILSGPRRKRININLEKINESAKSGDKIVIPGKVLSSGEIGKKINVVALAFSKKAEEKLLSAKCEVSSIVEEINKNPEAKGVKILK